MNINVLANTVIAAISVWAVFTSKVKMNSLEVCCMFFIFIAALVDIEKSQCLDTSQTFLDCSVALAASVWFVKTEITHRFNFKKRRRKNDVIA